LFGEIWKQRENKSPDRKDMSRQEGHKGIRKRRWVNTGMERKRCRWECMAIIEGEN
jgi:hypothetical protein